MSPKQKRIRQKEQQNFGRRNKEDIQKSGIKLTALRFQTGEDIRNSRPPFGGKKKKKKKKKLFKFTSSKYRSKNKTKNTYPKSRLAESSLTTQPYFALGNETLNTKQHCHACNSGCLHTTTNPHPTPPPPSHTHTHTQTPRTFRTKSTPGDAIHPVCLPRTNGHRLSKLGRSLSRDEYLSPRWRPVEEEEEEEEKKRRRKKKRRRRKRRSSYFNLRATNIEV